jgi:membrane protein YdbS with pleckstrin-like domain
MSRIQTVDYVEGAISRLFRLASVTATTASAAGALEIAGLDRDVARRLVDELTVKADSIPGDAT